MIYRTLHTQRSVNLYDEELLKTQRLNMRNKNYKASRPIRDSISSKGNSACRRKTSSPSIKMKARAFTPSKSLLRDVKSSTSSSTTPENLSAPNHCKHPHDHRSQLPFIMSSEIRATIKHLKQDKAPGEENITVSILQNEGESNIDISTKLFNRCFSSSKRSNCW